MLSLDEIRRAFSAHEPKILTDSELRRAAVAMILRHRNGAPEVLFIERAEREGDPWSGHMAFPGGRMDPDDQGPRRAAERETLEEVGLDLSGAESLGRLDDLTGGHQASGVPRIVISGFIYHLPSKVDLTPNHEVQDVFWFPLRGLLEAERHVEYRVGVEAWKPFPGIVVGDPDRHVVWGLTYRFLEVFFEVLGRRF